MRCSIAALLLACVLAFLGGCKVSTSPDSRANAPLPNSKAQNREDMGTRGFQLFRLGMDIEEVKEILQENQLEIINKLQFI